MAKMRAGIEIPIIPEDFDAIEEDFPPKTEASSLQEANRCFQNELYPVDWVLTKIFFKEHSQS